MPKILVGCPTSNHKEYCFEEYLKGIKELTYKNFDILLVDNSKDDDYYNKIKDKIPVIKDKYFENARDRIIHSRNILRNKVLSEGYDYLLSLEQDVIPPKDVIERLLKDNQKIVGGLYFKTGSFNELIPLVWLREDKNHARRANIEEIKEDKLIEVITCGLGCILIHRSVLEKIEFRYSKDKKAFDDVWFCEDARNNNFKIFCDTGIKCKHLIKGMNWDNIKK